MKKGVVLVVLIVLSLNIVSGYKDDSDANWEINTIQHVNTLNTMVKFTGNLGHGKHNSLNTDYVELKVNYHKSSISDLPNNCGAVLESNDSMDLTTKGVSGLKNVEIKKNGIAVVNLTLNFSQDINLSDIIANVNSTSGKSLFHVDKTKHPEIVSNYTLRIPVLQNTGTVYLCPNAVTLNQVNSSCPGMYLKSGLVNEGGYYYVTVSGTGGQESSGANKSMVEKDGSYALKLNSSGEKLYGIINDKVVSYPVSNPLSWHHYVLTYNGSVIKLYIDDVLVNSTAYSTALTKNSNPVYIGDFFSGFIDDVKIYNKSLSATEIKNLYNAGINNRTKTFVENETIKGQNWTAEIWGSDNTKLSAGLLSNQLEIENSNPELTSVNVSNEFIQTGNTQTINPSGQNDVDKDDLYLYCCNDTANSCTPSSSLNLCSEGSYSYPYTNMQCSFSVTATSGTVYVRCKTYDGTDYSNTASTNYTIDSNAPSINIVWSKNYAKGVINFNATTTDNSGLKDNSCISAFNNSAPTWYSAQDNFSDGDLSGFCNKTFDTTSLADGDMYTISFKVNDTADNQGSDSKDVYICNDEDAAHCGDACVDSGYHYNGTGYDDFDFESGNADCCGDDANENYINTTIGSSSYDACCDNSGDCVDSTGTCRDNTAESGATCTDGIDNDCDGYIDSEDSDCCPTIQGSLFIIQNVTNNCTLVDTDGDIAIKGTLSESCSSSPGINDFVVKSGSTVLMWVDHNNCNVCLKGTVSQAQSSITPGSNEFLIKNGTTNYVVKIDASGNLYSTGYVGSSCNI